MTDRPFTDQIAIVTGASAGIGRATALELSRRGALIHLVARSRDALDEARRAIEAEGGKAVAHAADLGSEQDVEALAAVFTHARGRVDLLVHSAGTYTHGDLETTPIGDLDLQYRVNVRGPYLLTQRLLPTIRASKGQIVFVNSTAGMTAGAGVSAYAASKHALKAVADSLRDEVNAAGVRVVSVFPGRTNTPMQRRVHALEGRPYHGELLMQPEDVATLIATTAALPRTAEVTNVTVRPARKT